ncbi:MAG: CD1871A family CXXC motif-containing protein [Bacillota bacterium]|jgi:hypothetical protein|nr:CD1871A family CXXC motif-containing protein [Eubacteriales bacterium]MDI9492217.1 CD1871A family CXXC motif-containing protein [Bacillota bacterium]NLV69684.1 thioredoxin [Clostridiales bacterium]MDD3537342.1 CD1871A family CXXC motif-containing protein [Eubacteriales bacterium]MDD4285695.1 CD1871A family CXXC motif-containing protein [Eubacteriales bacterium]
MATLCKKYKAPLLLGAGILFLGIGAFRGEIVVVLQKAVIICLECVGIG